ncbi:PAS domain S-box protein [Aeromicrobium sp. A1-2]|uniref:PAS domain S-box protein n=1 Tax=Aeromicrobium sp. A1-2 TaxID=2107713 RepID=UPI0020B12992|nr:PAS domain S-box protein [Aeromicrobium sp. A1-2]
MEKFAPTVVVIDDSAEVRALIKTHIRLSGLLTVVDDGADGTEAIGLAHRHQPELVLLDMSMPTLDALDALPGILAVSPHTRVVIYSGFEREGLADRARELGATAFFEKSMPVARLPIELRALLDAEPFAPAPPAPAPDQPTEGRNVLDEHLERFLEVFDEAAIGMATMTLTGGIVRANRALARLLMHPQDDLVGVDYATLTAGRAESLEGALEQINSAAADLVHIEHDVAGAPGPRTVLVALAAVRDSGGQALYIFVQAQDITAQRAAEGELRRSEDRFRLLVEAVDDYAIFMLSPEGIVASWNPGAQRSKGYTGQEIIGQHFRIFYPADRQAARHPEHELAVALQQGRYQEEGWRVRQDGTQFWAHVLISAVFNDRGEHIGFAKVTRDITERRAYEQERDGAAAALAEANVELESLNGRLQQALTDQAQFLAVTSHELRTPAAVLGGSADTLARHWTELTEGERATLLEGMSTSAARLRRLLSDLLTASRLDANALALHPERLRVSQLLETAVRTAQTTLADPGIRIAPGPEIEVMADPYRIGQAIDNLVDNALTHGGAPVGLSANLAGTMAEIRVTDSGDGVDPGIVPRLFERFATGDSIGGTGLGLFIVRELARANGGDARYEPEGPGHASGAFVLTVPLA